MKILILAGALFFFQDSVPLKPLDEFEVKLNFEFKQRTRADANRVDLDVTQGEMSVRKLPDHCRISTVT